MKRSENRPKNAGSQSFADWIVKRAGLQRRNNGKIDLAPTSPDGRLDTYLNRIKQLLKIANQQADELASERKKRIRSEKNFERARAELRESEKDRRELRRTLRRAGRELTSIRRGAELPAVTELREQLNAIQDESYNALNEEQVLRTQAEAELKEVQQELEELRRARNGAVPFRNVSISERVAEERGRRRKAEKEARNLKHKLRHASRSLNTLRRDHSKCRNPSYSVSSNGRVSDHSAIGDLLPNLTLARDSASRLFKARETKQIFDDLVRLHDSPQVMRGERVGSAEPWLEIRPTMTDRVYYRQDKGRRKYLVLIGDKQTQANDIAWMRRNN